MGLTYEDIKPRLDALKEKADHERAEQRRIRQGVAKEVSELLADPRWELYRQHLEQIRDSHEAQVLSLSERLLGGTLTDDEMHKTQALYQFHKGWSLGLKASIDLAVELVKRGSVDN